MTKAKLIETADGSHSLYIREMNETYHSTHGALTESRHVFLKEGVAHFLSSQNSDKLKILEVGFGTGLNALMMLDFARQHPYIQIEFITLEPYPIQSDLYEQLNFAKWLPNTSETDLLKLHEASHQERHSFDNFHFEKHHERVEDAVLDGDFNLIFFDAFAPNKQAEIWELSVLKQMYKAIESGGVLTTYCAQGQFKRSLAAAGFMVETLEGPPGKKEMVRGTKG